MKRMTPKEQALLRVQQMGFMTDDLRLFLNTHPEDEDALYALKEYLALEADARAAYEERYGSLTLESAVCSGRYDWIDHAWPWEAEG